MKPDVQYSDKEILNALGVHASQMNLNRVRDLQLEMNREHRLRKALKGITIAIH